MNKSKKYKLIISKILITLSILGIQLISFLPVQAQGITFDCKDLGNQAEGKVEGENKTESSLKNLLVVINEEPLGEDVKDIRGSSIKRCARKTQCKYDINIDNPKEDKWECSTTYEEISTCGKSESKPAAKPGATYSTCEIVQVYVSASGADLLFTYIAQIYRYAALTGGIVAVFFLILGGIMIASSGDNAEAVGKGKDIIVRSITGIIVLFLSALILYTVNPNFFTI